VLFESVFKNFSGPDQATLKKVQWHDRLVSLWAPVTVLAVAFGLYLCCTESVICSYRFFQPLMHGLGLVCFAWWAGLLVARLALRPWNFARRQRYASEDVLADVEQVASKNWDKLSKEQQQALSVSTEKLLKLYVLPGDGLALESALKNLSQLADTTLSQFKRGKLFELGTGFTRALAVAVLFRVALVEPYKIPSGSMQPTLEIGDQIFVNKFIYGVRLPFTNYVPFVLVREPKRGDVVVFNNPVRLELDYIKRVVGVPGDTLEFTEAGVILNGTVLATREETPGYMYWDQPQPGFNDDLGTTLARWRRQDWYTGSETLLRETLDGKEHYILEEHESRLRMLPAMMQTKVTVPKGHVFVMGDNRNHSEDSRFGLGNSSREPEFVPFGNIKGKAMSIWLALGHGGFGESIFGGTGIRYDRFFKPVTLCGNEAPLSAQTR
jgi:signal peptidase I